MSRNITTFTHLARCVMNKFLTKINPIENMEELRKSLREQCQLQRLNDGYFSIHKQNVMDEVLFLK